VSASVVILGGGLSGMAAALALARAGFGEVCLVERGAELGGLAGTFERDGFFYPLAYHHILHRDRCLHYFLAEIGALERVRWRRVRMLFELGGRFWNLARPNDLLRFPMTARDKLRLATLMARAFTKAEWHDWEGRSARELVERWASPGVANTLFEPLCRLKFGLPAAAVSGAWLGARLNFREGSSSLGYIPGCNWTKVLCDGLGERLADAGVRVLLGAGARRLHGRGALIEALELAGGERLQADAFISTVPPPSYLRMVSADATPGLERIRYTSVVSAICATHQRLAPDFYWLNLLSLEHSACGLFVLSSLNPSIGAPGETCLNFVTHLGSRDEPLFALDDEALWQRYHADFRKLFGFGLEPSWSHLSRIALYSPVLDRAYRNPPLRSASWRNLYFAGNYRSFPSTVTTGTALATGLEAAAALLADHGLSTPMLAAAHAFRRGAMRRAR
jgi:protoporphyrinogen oxidase